MYQIDLNTCSALDIIQRSVTCHPSLFREAIEARIAQDRAYAADKTGKVLVAVNASRHAAECGLAAVDADDVDSLRHDMGAGIILLNIACRLQCVPPHVRTSAAVRTWEKANAA